ncbi:hypothetical protein SUGI_0988530 [Cryptomeria japonica]|nr:hypothetical protein SUGI_0988530 [Cryptomeria japonica]
MISTSINQRSQVPDEAKVVDNGGESVDGGTLIPCGAEEEEEEGASDGDGTGDAIGEPPGAWAIQHSINAATKSIDTIALNLPMFSPCLARELELAVLINEDLTGQKKTSNVYGGRDCEKAVI